MYRNGHPGSPDFENPATVSVANLVSGSSFNDDYPSQGCEGIEPRLTALRNLATISNRDTTHNFAVTRAQDIRSLPDLGWFFASAYVLYWLGRSFSIMAEARRLVLWGPMELSGTRCMWLKKCRHRHPVAKPVAPRRIAHRRAMDHPDAADAPRRTRAEPGLPRIRQLCGANAKNLAALAAVPAQKPT